MSTAQVVTAPAEGCPCAFCAQVRHNAATPPMPRMISPSYRWVALLSWVVLKAVEKTVETWLGKPAARVFTFLAGLMP